MGWVSFLEDLQTIRDENEALANEESMILGNAFISEEKTKKHSIRSAKHLKKLNELFSKIDRYLNYATDPSLDATKALEKALSENGKLKELMKGEISKRGKLKKRFSKTNKAAQETHLENQQLKLRIIAYEIGGSDLPLVFEERPDFTGLDADPKTQREMLKIEISKLKVDKKRLWKMLKNNAE